MATATSYSNSFCEAWIGGEWIVVPVQTGLSNPNLTVRCMECNGPIILMNAGKNDTTRAHAEHRPKHAGCSIGYHFDGTRTPHPHQVSAPTGAEVDPIESGILSEDDESSFPEGKKKYRQHRQLERDPKLAKKAKARRFAQTGKLECDVCEFDFFAIYGEIGHGFIEAHHKTPVSELDGVKKTKIRDLALVCANCHRMLHRGKSLMTVEDLRAIVKSRICE